MLHFAHTRHPAPGQTLTMSSPLLFEVHLFLDAGMLAKAERLTNSLHLPLQVTPHNTS